MYYINRFSTCNIICLMGLGFVLLIFQGVLQAQGTDPETGFPWGKHNAPTGYISHFEQGTKVRSTRAAMSRAAQLLSSDEARRQKEGCRVLGNILKYQDCNPESKTYGVWPWYVEEPLEEMLAVDYNWADFLGATLISILEDYPDRLPKELLEQTKAALDRCCVCIIRRDVMPKYTNIAYMGAVVTAAGGEILQKPDYLEYAKKRMERNIAAFEEIGGFCEYNSPTYTFVVLEEMERALQYVKDEQFRAMAQKMHKEVWKMIAAHFHPATRQWAGPFSRTYSDLLRPQDLTRILGRVGLVPLEQKANAVPVPTPLPCPEEFKAFFTRTLETPVVLHENYNNSRENFRESGAVYLDSDLCFGTASYYTFWFQTRGMAAFWNDSAGRPVALKQRFLHNGRDFASAAGRTRQENRRAVTAYNLLSNCGSLQPGQDRPKDKTFLAESFQIVYELTGSEECTINQINETQYELSAGKIRAVIHICPSSRFESAPIVWKTESDTDKKTVRLIGVCYSGEEKAFNMERMGEIRIGTGVELLKANETPSNSPVIITDSVYTTKSEGAFYEVKWDSVDTNSQPLLAPVNTTKR